MLVALAAGCSSQVPPRAPAATTTSATAMAERIPVEACGARFGVPADWRPSRPEPGLWQLDGGPGQGFSASVRCLPATRYPHNDWRETAEVVAALELDEAGAPSQDSLRYLQWIEGRQDGGSGPVPGLIALRREATDAHPHGLRRQVALWPVAADCDGAGPCTGLLSVRWSDDVPGQRRRYEALSAALAETLKLPEPHY